MEEFWQCDALLALKLPQGAWTKINDMFRGWGRIGYSVRNLSILHITVVDRPDHWMTGLTYQSCPVLRFNVPYWIQFRVCAMEAMIGPCHVIKGPCHVSKGPCPIISLAQKKLRFFCVSRVISRRPQPGTQGQGPEHEISHIAYEHVPCPESVVHCLPHQLLTVCVRLCTKWTLSGNAHKKISRYEKPPTEDYSVK